jgi:hypothetical protein
MSGATVERSEWPQRVSSVDLAHMISWRRFRARLRERLRAAIAECRAQRRYTKRSKPTHILQFSSMADTGRG